MTASTLSGNLTELSKWAKLWSELLLADPVDQLDPGDSGSPAPARIVRNLTSVPLRPLVECRMINRDTLLGHDLLKVAVGHPVAQVEEDRMQDNVIGKVDTFE